MGSALPPLPPPPPAAPPPAAVPPEAAPPGPADAPPEARAPPDAVTPPEPPEPGEPPTPAALPDAETPPEPGRPPPPPEPPASWTDPEHAKERDNAAKRQPNARTFMERFLTPRSSGSRYHTAHRSFPHVGCVARLDVLAGTDGSRAFDLPGTTAPPLPNWTWWSTYGTATSAAELRTNLQRARKF